MDRRACVDLPDLPLQVLLAGNASWKELPVAVVDRDEPQGMLLSVNGKARRAGLRPGMHHAGALTLERRLRAAAVAPAAVANASARAGAALRKHTPEVEPSPGQPGTFHLGVRGLERLYGSMEAWACRVLAAILDEGFEARVVVGFTRFGTWAIARSLLDAGAGRSVAGAVRSSAGAGRGRPPSILVCPAPSEEVRLAAAAPLEGLGLDPALLAALRQLGLGTLGDFAALPAQGIRRRFGEDAWRLHRLAGPLSPEARNAGSTGSPSPCGKDSPTANPLSPAPPAANPMDTLLAPAGSLRPTEPLRRSILLDDPVSGIQPLLFLMRRLLAPLLEAAAGREQGIAAVTATLRAGPGRRAAPLVVAVRAAAATLEEALLVDLLRLRLEGLVRSAKAADSFLEVELAVEAAAADREQLRLFAARPRRDLAAAARALARLRAELGEAAVVRAVLRDGHLPEARFAWEPVEDLVEAAPRSVQRRPLVRRLEERAIPLPPDPLPGRDAPWIESAAGGGRVEERAGPYLVSGGWWNREVHREYHYLRTSGGEILWIYHDRRRRRWMLAGRVE